MAYDKVTRKLIANNKKATHEYFIEETFEAGICLEGAETRSVKNGKCSIKEAFVSITNGEVYIKKMNITPFEQRNSFTKVNPLQDRKLLLHKSEINFLMGRVAEKGYTIVPLRIEVVGRYVKVIIALAKGKNNYDKRQDLAKKEAQREMQRIERGKY